MLTAKAEVADRVEGLDRGATDYLTKPFAFDELLARIRARLRESGDGSETSLEAAGIRLDLLTREATRGDGIAVRLPEREAELLAHLMRHAGRVCTREEILSAVWGYDHDPGTNVVQVYVGYLRRKLGLPGSPAPIETVRSVGYRLRERAMRRAWARLGLRGRLALSIGGDRRRSPSRSSSSPCGRRWRTSPAVIKREEARGARPNRAPPAERGEGSAISPIEDAQSDVEKTFLAGRRRQPWSRALLAGYLLAARTASPLRRFAATAAEVDAGDLTPRLDPSPPRPPSCAPWPRPSTTCSTASTTPSRGSGSSSPTPRTSCAAR